MGVIERIFRYPDGHEEREPSFETHESYGVGETLERDGIRWKAIEGRAMVGGDPNQVEVVFVPE
jgi:hypothetical protein